MPGGKGEGIGRAVHLAAVLPDGKHSYPAVQYPVQIGIEMAGLRRETASGGIRLLESTQWCYICARTISAHLILKVWDYVRDTQGERVSVRLWESGTSPTGQSLQVVYQRPTDLTKVGRSEKCPGYTGAPVMQVGLDFFLLRYYYKILKKYILKIFFLKK